MGSAWDDVFDDWEDGDNEDDLVVEDAASPVGLVVGLGVKGILLLLELKMFSPGLRPTHSEKGQKGHCQVCGAMHGNPKIFDLPIDLSIFIRFSLRLVKLASVPRVYVVARTAGLLLTITSPGPFASFAVVRQDLSILSCASSRGSSGTVSFRFLLFFLV